MDTNTTTSYDIDGLNALSDQQLSALEWRELNCFNGRLLELHAEGALGNENAAKLPRKPILCIDQIDLLDESQIEASFTFPAEPGDWAFATSESLEMLFQDQLDQLVGFWASRKIEGIGRALSSGNCVLHQSLDFEANKRIRFVLQKRKWMENKDSGGGTAVFNARILDAEGELIMETRNVIVGILALDDILELRQKHGGTQGVEGPAAGEQASELRIPVFDQDHGSTPADEPGSFNRVATQAISPKLWPLKYHFKADPVVPGNFGTHGMIALLKAAAVDNFGLKNPVFKSLSKKSFSGMIFEDEKQIRFELIGISQAENGDVVAATANLYLEDKVGNKMIDDPIYTFKNLTVAESA
ncbi:MAG: hypothetical protein ACPGSC_13555 [Granulosicoccaceae bacterium]